MNNWEFEADGADNQWAYSGYTGEEAGEIGGQNDFENSEYESTGFLNESRPVMFSGDATMRQNPTVVDFNLKLEDNDQPQDSVYLAENFPRETGQAALPMSPKDESSLSEEMDAQRDNGAFGYRARRYVHTCPSFLEQRDYSVEEVRALISSGRFNEEEMRELRSYLKVVYNRYSASASRVRRKQTLFQLESDIESMHSEDSDLTNQITELGVENRILKEQLLRMRRIIKNTALARLANYSPEVAVEDPEATAKHMIALAFAHFLSANPAMLNQVAHVMQSPHFSFTPFKEI